MQKEPYILTLELDAESQQFFNSQRDKYFPVERNFLRAHLTLFHQLPPQPETISYLSKLQVAPFEMEVAGLMKLGAGVAYRIESEKLKMLHQEIKHHFQPFLIPQDRQSIRPHITVQNKVTVYEANMLFDKLDQDFKPFIIQATGLQIHTYLGGPWRHEHTFKLFNR